jgi:hypothetical protein
MPGHNRLMGETKINFVAFDDSRDACLMVLVEGPWTESTEDHLRALQERIYGCLDAALDGQLAEQFPQAIGKTVVVRLDCYDVPRIDVDEFFGRFVAGVSTLPDYATEGSSYVADFCFELNHCSLPD